MRLRLVVVAKDKLGPLVIFGTIATLVLHFLSVEWGFTKAFLEEENK